ITERKHAEDELNRYKVRLEDRAAELKEKNTELERINDLFVGRELRIKELRERVKELESTIEKFK
ncbi:MAG: hypothetical protein U9N63_01320, partial [Pseudomonadota bacterium]|nr:hypothetical protein [Pseudomonadota bacterium]